MDYISDFHWIWYGLGFLIAPRLTIMIVLSIHLKNFIPLPLMVGGWVVGILELLEINEKGGK